MVTFLSAGEKVRRGPPLGLDVEDRPRRQPLAAMPPLTPAEEAALAEEQRRLARFGEAFRERTREARAVGFMLLEARESELWMRDPRGFPSFFAYVRAVSRVHSEDTLVRRLRLARCFDDATFEDMIASGASMSAMVQLSMARPDEYPLLLPLLKDLTAGQMAVAVAALRRLPQPLTEEVREAAARHTLEQIRKDALKRRAKKPPAPPAPPPAPINEDRRDLDRDERDHHSGPDDVLAQIIEQRRQLDAESAAFVEVQHHSHMTLVARQDEVEQAVVRAKAELEQLQQRIGEVSVALEKKERHLDDLAAICEGVQQAIEEQKAEHAALVERSQHLEEEEERLRQKEALFDKIIDDQERGRKEARLLRQILDNEAAELSERRERVLEMEHDVANYIVDWGRAQWPERPYTIVACLQQMRDLVIHLANVANHSVYKLFKEEYQYLPRGYGELLWLLKCAKEDAEQAVDEAIAAHGKEFIFKYGKKQFDLEMQDIIDRMKQAERDGNNAPLARSGNVDPREQHYPGFTPPPVVVLGTDQRMPKQYGFFAVESPGGKGSILTTLNEPQGVVITGMMNAGKTNTLLVYLEMLVEQQEHLSLLRRPLTVLWCHYARGFDGRAPSIMTSMEPNDEAHSQGMLQALRAQPRGIRRMKVIVPPLEPAELAQRRSEYARYNIPVIEMKPTLGDLQVEGMLLMMLAEPNPPRYINKLVALALDLPAGSGPEELRQAIKGAGFDKSELRHLEERLKVLLTYLGTQSMRPLFKEEGTVFIADMRAKGLTELQATVNIAILKDLMVGEPDEKGRRPHRAVFFDEAQKLLGKGVNLPDRVVESMAEMRHLGLWSLLALPDPSMLDGRIGRHSTIQISHRLRSQKGYEELKSWNINWEKVPLEQLSNLDFGEVYLLSDRASEKEYTEQPHRGRVRPSVSKPGGTTKLHVEEDDPQSAGIRKVRGIRRARLSANTIR